MCNQLIHFSQLIEGVGEKYKELQEQIEFMDADIFIYVPCLLILKSLDNEDKGICQSFYPLLYTQSSKEAKQYKELKKTYHKLLNRSEYSYEFYNIIEEKILERNSIQNLYVKCKVDEAEIDTLVHVIKNLAIGLQRYNPTEWNSFLDVALGQS
jgi:hypothetical protein